MKPCSASLGLILLLLIPSAAFAHRLHADYRVRPGWRVAIESWFETGESASEASVKLLRADGSVLCTGTLDAKGVFVFSYSRAEPLRAVVSDGTGHRAEKMISEKDLAAGLCAEASAVGTCLQPAGPLTAAVLFREAEEPPGKAAETFADRDSPWPTWKVVLGVGVLLALALIATALNRARAKS